MARTPIHPGEHLREELEALEMSAAELSRQLGVPTNRVTGILKWPALDHRGHGIAPRPFLRHQPRILAKPADPI